jgi:TolB protein
MPRWSPDGTRIVFASVPPGAGREIWVMNADGTGQRALTSLGTNPGFPDWSPDGREIAFHAARGDGNFDLFVMDADGSNIRRLTTRDSYLRPRWSPDGSRIAAVWFQTSAGSFCCSKVAVMDSDGGNLRVLTFGMQEADPEWSSDGRQIAYAQYMGLQGGMSGFPMLAIIDAAGTGERTFGMNTLGATNIAWSRTSSRIYFMSNRTGWEQIYSIRPNGTDLQRVSRIGVAADFNPHAR